MAPTNRLCLLRAIVLLLLSVSRAGAQIPHNTDLLYEPGVMYDRVTFVDGTDRYLREEMYILQLWDLSSGAMLKDYFVPWIGTRNGCFSSYQAHHGTFGVVCSGCSEGSACEGEGAYVISPTMPAPKLDDHHRLPLESLGGCLATQGSSMGRSCRYLLVDASFAGDANCIYFLWGENDWVRMETDPPSNSRHILEKYDYLNSASCWRRELVDSPFVKSFVTFPGDQFSIREGPWDVFIPGADGSEYIFIQGDESLRIGSTRRVSSEESVLAFHWLPGVYVLRDDAVLQLDLQVGGLREDADVVPFILDGENSPPEGLRPQRPPVQMPLPKQIQDFSPDRDQLLIYDRSAGRLLLVGTLDWKIIESLEVDPEVFGIAYFIENGSRVLLATDGRLRVYDTDDFACRFDESYEYSPTGEVSVGYREEDCLLLLHSDKTIYIWQPDSCE